MLPKALVRRRRGPSVRQALNGYQQTCLVITAVRLRLIESMGRRRVTSRELAEALELDEMLLHRLLRGLQVIGVVENRGGRFRLTKEGTSLLDDDSPMRALALLVAEEYMPAWAHLDKAVLSGEPAFEVVFGEDVWQHRSDRPEMNHAFNRLMTRFQKKTLQLIEEAFDFSGDKVIVDLGSGHGELLAGLLERNAKARGVAFDQPHVVQGASKALEESGVLGRCELVGGSFFESVPRGADVYILRHVLHDWKDEASIAILRTCSAAMDAHSSLLIVEGIMSEGSTGPTHLIMRDLHMMAVTGGRERTEREFVELLGESGLELIGVHSTPLGAVLEAKRR